MTHDATGTAPARSSDESDARRSIVDRSTIVDPDPESRTVSVQKERGRRNLTVARHFIAWRLAWRVSYAHAEHHAVSCPGESARPSSGRTGSGSDTERDERAAAVRGRPSRTRGPLACASHCLIHGPNPDTQMAR